MIKKIKRLTFLALVLLSISFIYAEKTPVEGLYQYKMQNGLSVFIAENHTVPLVYVEIAIRAGAITQTKETAGLFHLYEHMMFKGNRLYPDAASVNRALSDLGVANWNGTTGVNHVNYFFIIPSDRIEEGLAFWNAAIRSPLITEVELENEKKVVLSEIEGGKSDPSKIYGKYINSSLFPDAPYKVDSAGSFEVVKNATVEQLRDIQNEFYIPSNSALFIGGDINPDETFALVEKIFGSWSNNGNEPTKNTFQQNPSPFTSPHLCVMPFDRTSDEFARISILFRGPDTDFDIEDTYAVDYLLYLLDEPDGLYAQSLYKNKEFKIPDFNNSWAQYATVRANGLFEFGTLVKDPLDSLPERAKKILTEIQSSIIPNIISDKNLFTESYKEKVIERIKDSQTQGNETASALLSSLRNSWINTSDEYYYNYFENLEKVTQEDVQHVAEKYIIDKNPLLSVLINPLVFSETKTDFEEKGFSEIPLNTDFLKESEESDVKGTEEKRTKDPSLNEDTEIYVPENKKSKDLENGFSSRICEEKKLKNGIPIYINPTDDKVITLAIVCKGGVENLTPDTSGLETTLFSFMASSSKNFPYKKRTELSYETNADIGYWAKLSGSALELTVLDKYFEKTLPILIDGFLNPTFKKDEYENTMSRLRQKLQATLNSPESLLGYTISDTVYKGHPYEARTSATEISLKNITIQNLKSHHKKLLSEGNFFVVVSGKVNQDSLLSTLNSSLGKLKFSTSEKKEKEILPIEIEEKSPVIITHTSAEGTSYIARVFSSPPSYHEDYIPAVLAGNIYTDIMFNVVREHYGVCYSPSSYVIGSKAPYGMEYLFKVSDFKGFKKAMDEARNYMENGVVVEKTNPDGSYGFSSVDACLESYKNSFINQTYSSQATSEGLVSLLGYNLLQFNDLDYDLKQLTRLKETSSEDIIRVFKKYWVENPFIWFALTGPETLLDFGSD